jgi:anti-sigma factor RsiW
MACLDYKNQLTDAALALLAPGEGASQNDSGLRAHLDACADCAAEFARTRLLLSAIDRGVAASVSPEPSPEMMARLRRRIAEEPAPHFWTGTWIPVVAAALAVAVAAFLWLGIRTATHSIAPAASGELVTHSTPGQAPRRAQENGASARLAPPASSHLATSRALKPGGKLDVLVPPGQMAAVLELQAALKNGSVDPSSIASDKDELGEALDIARLKISPLEFPALDAAEEHPKDSGNR